MTAGFCFKLKGQVTAPAYFQRSSGVFGIFILDSNAPVVSRAMLTLRVLSHEKAKKKIPGYNRSESAEGTGGISTGPGSSLAAQILLPEGHVPLWNWGWNT